MQFKRQTESPLASCNYCHWNPARILLDCLWACEMQPRIFKWPNNWDPGFVSLVRCCHPPGPAGHSPVLKQRRNNAGDFRSLWPDIDLNQFCSAWSFFFPKQYSCRFLSIIPQLQQPVGTQRLGKGHHSSIWCSQNAGISTQFPKKH